jgi:SRSO17 transposase
LDACQTLSPGRSFSLQIKPLIELLVEPVLERLDRHEALLTEMKRALDIQFKRTAEVQAQLDKLTALVKKSRT